MIHLRKWLFVSIVIMFACSVSWADVYRWEDENGVVHYTDTPPGDVTEWEEVGETPSAEDKRQDENNEPQRPAYDEQAITELLKELNDETEEIAEVEEDNTPSVEIFTTSWCTYCNKAKSFFRSKGIAYIEYNIEQDKKARQRMLSLTKSRAVPFVIINGKQIQGYSAAAYERALNN